MLMKMINNQVQVNAAESKEKHIHPQRKVSAAVTRSASEWKAKTRLICYFAVLCLLFASSAFGQGARFDSVAQKNVQGFLAPIPGATITGCSAAATGAPCSPITPIYTDAALTQQIPGSTFQADANGNFGFFAPASTTYKVSITAPGVTGQLLTVVMPMVGGGIGTFTNVTTTGLNGCQEVNASQSFATALAAVGSSGCIEVTPGTFPVTASATVPAAVTLRHTQGGILQISCGQKLTVAGPFQAGLNQTFSSAACSGGQSAAITAATQNPGSTVAITAASESGNTVTITTTLNPGVGNQVLIAGVTPAGYNEACWVLSSSGANFTCYNPTNALGAGTVFGTAGVITNIVTITSTLNPGANNLVQISGVTPAAYNGTFWVVSSGASSFTVFNNQIGIAAGTVFGTATLPGTAVFTLPGNEAITRPEWFGGVSDGTLTTPVTGTDNQAAFTFALNALPIFTLPSQGSYTDNNGMVSRTGTMKLSLGRYVTSPIQWSERVKYECPSYAGCTVTLKNGITGTNEVFAVQVAANPSGANATFGPQFQNISVDCNGSPVYGSNTQASGMFLLGAQGTAIGTMEVFNCGRRGIWMAPQASGVVAQGSSINGVCDIWVTLIGQGPGIQIDGGVTFCSSIRAESINTSAGFLDADGDPNAGILIGSQLSNGSQNFHIGMGTGENDGLPVKVWGGDGIDIDNLQFTTLTGGQATASIISHAAGGVWFGRFFIGGSTPNVFTNCVVDRTATPTANVPCNVSFALNRGYYNHGGTGTNVGPFTFNDFSFAETSSDPNSFVLAGFDSCRGSSSSTPPVHGMACSFNGAPTQTLGFQGFTFNSNNQVTLTAATDTQLVEFSLPAGYLNIAGRTIRIKANGSYTNPAAQTPTLTFKVKLCTVSGCGSGTVVTEIAFTTTAATTASVTDFWKIDADLEDVTTGAAGQNYTMGALWVTIGATGNTTPTLFTDSNVSAGAAIDHTASLFLDIMLNESTSASNTAIARLAYIQPVN